MLKNHSMIENIKPLFFGVFNRFVFTKLNRIFILILPSRTGVVAFFER